MAQDPFEAFRRLVDVLGLLRLLLRVEAEEVVHHPAFGGPAVQEVGPDEPSHDLPGPGWSGVE